LFLRLALNVAMLSIFRSEPIDHTPIRSRNWVIYGLLVEPSNSLALPVPWQQSQLVYGYTINYRVIIFNKSGDGICDCANVSSEEKLKTESMRRKLQQWRSDWLVYFITLHTFFPIK
jgi:hypothetical protein